jgi:hypothetical protein
VEFNTAPVLLQNASFRKSYALAQGRCVLSGASGTRLLNRYCWENEDQGFDPEEALVAYFHACQAVNAHASIPVKPAPKNLPIAIECRNTFNYYHFITESLSQLAALVAQGHQGDVHFHFPNDPEKTRAFVLDFATALFPEFAGRIHLHRAPVDYDQVLTAFDLSCAYYQFPASIVGDLAPLAPSDAMFRGHDAYRGAHAILSMNSFTSGLAALRTRALQAIKGHDFTHLPRRFFVGRDDRKSRKRDMVGDAALCEMLALFGFEYVVFENFTPLEQIALMANAQVMVSYHGAGFTNMLFANPDAYVIELGTLQTAIHRWGDFWGVAHASGCRYISFFADFNQPDPLALPSFDLHGIVPVALSNQAVAEVSSFIVTILGHLPDLPSAAALHTLADRLIAVRDHPRALQLLDRHTDLVTNNAALCLLMADCHKHADTPHAELVALHMAYQADKTRWQTLVRLVWCAKRCDLPDVLDWALSQLQHDFPGRYAALVKSKPWLRKRF